MRFYAVVLSLCVLAARSSWAVGAGDIDTLEYRQIARYSHIRVDVYGPVVRGETLWKIATFYHNPASASLNQVMMGLFRHNPEAFNRGNINCLKQGALLIIPDSIARKNRRRSSAENKIVDHYRRWQAMSQRCTE